MKRKETKRKGKEEKEKTEKRSTIFFVSVPILIITARLFVYILFIDIYSY